MKFTEVHRDAPAPRSPPRLLAWRDVLWRLGLIGQDPARYDGAGFGNASVRVGRGFVVTATQTGARATLRPRDLVLVTRTDLAANRVWARGASHASSESMTHAAVYAADARVRAVLHAHSPEIRRARRALRLPTTRATVAYGTPAMAREVARLFRERDVARRGAFAMGGHEDGVMTFGRDVDEAGARMVALLADALALRGRAPSRPRRARTRRAP